MNTLKNWFHAKEIGIQKVIGATVFDLWKLLSKEFLVLVVI